MKTDELLTVLEAQGDRINALQVALDDLARSHDELVGWLCQEAGKTRPWAVTHPRKPRELEQ